MYGSDNMVHGPVPILRAPGAASSRHNPSRSWRRSPVLRHPPVGGTPGSRPLD